MIVIAFPTTFPLDVLSEADCVAESLAAVHVEILASGELAVERDHLAALSLSRKVGGKASTYLPAANPN